MQLLQILHIFRSEMLPVLFTLAVGLSAILLFLVQPIIARQILPWFGGGAGVWTICMVFFQTALLAGYAYADTIARRCSLRRQALIHLALLCCSMAMLPIVPAGWLRPEPGEDAALAILRLLALTVGAPFVMLSATSPLLQSWMLRTQQPKAVYRLFAISNVGSLAGLLAYPLLIEARWDVAEQTAAWGMGYSAFALVLAAIACRTALAPGDGVAYVPPAPLEGATHGARRYRSWTWLLLAFLGSLLLLGSTEHLTQNVAAIPFLWVLPLVAYLASFVVAFEGRNGQGWYSRKWIVPAAAIGAALMSAGLPIGDSVLDFKLAVPLYCGGAFICCLLCHGELYARRPEGEALTRFYLVIAVGGALGSVFVGLVAPRLFNRIVEFPVALIAVCAVAGLVAAEARWHWTTLLRPIVAVPLVALVATTAYTVSYLQSFGEGALVMQRNFFGTIRVTQIGEGIQQVRHLVHGVIVHGEQPTMAPDRLQPLAYYSRTSGVGLAIEAAQSRGGPLRLGVIGLGAGAIAAYGREGDELRFYEIDPDIVQIAKQQFTYLSASRARTAVVVGDGRVSIERELANGSQDRFDVLVVDAFSGDSIPAHLLTREALALYLRGVGANGVVAFHVSNLFFDLPPVLANVAHDLGARAWYLHDDANYAFTRTMPSDWVLVAADAERFAEAPFRGRGYLLAATGGARSWTDSYYDVLGASRSITMRRMRALVGRSN